MAVKAMYAMEGLTFGADPELFIVNDKDDFVSAAGMIPGTKEEPFKVEYGAVQVDGMAAEFNIDPVTTYKDWKKHIEEVRKQLAAMLPKGYKLVPVSTAKFSENEWFKAPDEAKVLGCSPDFNAWEKSVNPAPSAKDFVRHAGGHIHVGWTNGADTSDTAYVNSCVDLVRQLDWFLGAWSVLKDPDKQRRKSYGKAGSMRFKPYGAEYRALSNFWLNTDDNPYILLEVWNRLQSAVNHMGKIFMPVEYDNYNKKLITSINESNTSFVSQFSFPVMRYK